MNNIKIPSLPSNKELISEFGKELNDILVWWNTNMVDEEHGGFYGRVSGQNVLDKKGDKGVILATRLLWTYSAVTNSKQNTSYANLADRAYHYLVNHFWDQLNSGMYWSVDYLGNPLDTRKQIYAQAFAMYALSEYYLLTKNKQVINQATEIFWLIEKYSRDLTHGGYLNAFNRDWSEMEDTSLSEKDANEAKIMNTHLHILEAYTLYHKVFPSQASADALMSCTKLVLDKFYISNNGSLQIYFNETWQPKGDHISFGHNIEASWLLCEAALALENHDLVKRTFAIAANMANAVLNNAVCNDGSIYYEGKGDSIIDDDRHWWVQAEAVVGFWNAALITGEEKYKIAAINCLHYIQNKIIDKKHGEWFWKVDTNGEPDLQEDKAGPWKAPYHNTRMCLQMIEFLETS